MTIYLFNGQRELEGPRVLDAAKLYVSAADRRREERNLLWMCAAGLALGALLGSLLWIH